MGASLAQPTFSNLSSPDTPSKFLLLAEGVRATVELSASVALWPLLQLAPRGDGHAVLVLPGLMGDDWSTTVLRDYLKGRGYAAVGWGLGTNLGPRDGVEQGLVDLLEELNERSGGPVSVVGWSLGGVYARLLAARRPELVRSVVTLGSPIAGDPRASNAWRVYEAVGGKSTPDDPRMRLVAATPPVPTTSIFSRSDGVVSWHTSIQRAGPQAESIEVDASHLGLGAHPAVLYALADRLSQRQGGWQPFRAGLLNWLFPDPAHH